MIETRDYQQEQVKLLRKGFSKVQRQILRSPTGSGKTVVMAFILSHAVKKGTRTWVLTDREELCEQTDNVVTGLVGSEVQTITKKTKTFKDAPIVIGMVETINRRLATGQLDRLPSPDLIIIDECHRRSFNKILDKFPDVKVLGLSATPQGKHLYSYYDRIVGTIDIPDLISMGYLLPYRAFQMQDDLSDVGTANGEFKKKELFDHFNDQKLFKGVVEEYLKRTPGQKALCFNVNVEHSEKMTREFREAGISAETVTGKTPKHERDRIIRGFKQGLFSVLNNCGVLTTGFDDPSIEVIILNRATQSLPLFLQMIGRGSRPCEGLNYFTVLDFGMNHHRHGMWDEPREWHLEPPKKNGGGGGEPPVKDCPDCEAVVSASATQCPECGHKFEVGQREAEGEMKEVAPHVPINLQGKAVSELSVDELLELQNAKKYKASFVWRVLRTRGKDALEEYQQKAGYKRKWVFKQLKEVKNGNTGFTNYILKD